MTPKKKILLVSATRGKNYELAQELKEIIDNTTIVDTAVINLSPMICRFTRRAFSERILSEALARNGSNPPLCSTDRMA